MNTRKLTNSEILSGYDEVCRFYPYIPPLTIWRMWEYAVYKHYKLEEPVLDIGCGDGQFFKHVWPSTNNVIGVDSDRNIAKIAENSGVYQRIYVAPAHKLPVTEGSCKSAFANCALEHMDCLTEVLEAIHRSLCSEGHFLFSVVTDKLIEWSTLTNLISLCGNVELAEKIQSEYVKYHHLKNPLSHKNWIKVLIQSGFEIVDYWPIVTEVTSSFFMFVDQLWHIPTDNGEIGYSIPSYLQKLTDYPKQFRKILEAILNMEYDHSVSSGIVFYARKR